MTWTAEVTSVSKSEGNVVALVRFYDSDIGEVILRNVPAQDLTLDSLAEFCQQVIEGLEKRDAAAKLIVNGPVVLPRDATDQATKDKVVAIAAADAFFVLLATYNAKLVQVNKGILLANDKTVSDAASAMKAAFLPEYARDFRFK